MSNHLPSVVNCPVCGRRPTIDRCEPWPSEHGPAPYYAGCYGEQPIEHFVGVNADSVRGVMEAWNIAATPLSPLDEPGQASALSRSGRGGEA